jgi:hypothetical protein
MGALEMTSLLKFGAIAASRGEDLHPKLRDLFERVAMFPIRKSYIMMACCRPGRLRRREIRSRLATSFRGYVTVDGSSRT